MTLIFPKEEFFEMICKISSLGIAYLGQLVDGLPIDGFLIDGLPI